MELWRVGFKGRFNGTMEDSNWSNLYPTHLQPSGFYRITSWDLWDPRKLKQAQFPRVKRYSWKIVISLSVVMNIDSFMRDFMRQPCVDDRFCPTYLYIGFGITKSFWFDGLCPYKHEHSDLISALGRFKIRCWQCCNSVLPILTLGWLQDASSKNGHQNMSQLAEKGWLRLAEFFCDHQSCFQSQWTHYRSQPQECKTCRSTWGSLGFAYYDEICLNV